MLKLYLLSVVVVKCNLLHRRKSRKNWRRTSQKQQLKRTNWCRWHWGRSRSWQSRCRRSYVMVETPPWAPAMFCSRIGWCQTLKNFTSSSAMEFSDQIFGIFTPLRRSYAICAVCLSVCLSVILSEQDNSQTHLRMSTKCGRHWQGVTLCNWLNFDVDPNLYVDLRSLINVMSVRLIQRIATHQRAPPICHASLTLQQPWRS